MPCQNKVTLKAYLKPEEYDKIKAKAAQARLSVSQYVRAVCLGFEPKTKTDREAMLAMLEVNRDLSRLGNLLKLSLTQDGFDENKIKELINSIAKTKALLVEKVKAI